MINDLISNLIIAFDDLLSRLGLYTKFTELVGYLDDFIQYKSEFNKYLSGVYYIFGKPLVMYLIGVFVVIVSVRIIFAIVHLIGQFVP